MGELLGSDMAHVEKVRPQIVGNAGLYCTARNVMPTARNARGIDFGRA